MRKILLVQGFAVLFVLGGCASSPSKPPNPLSKVPDLAGKKLDEVSKYIFPYSKVGAPDETEKLQHWKLTGQFWNSLNRNQAEGHVTSVMPNFEQYCSAINGEMAEPKNLFEAAQPGAVEVICNDKKSHKAVFLVAAGLKECSRLTEGDAHYLQGAREVRCEVWVDSFAFKSPGELQDVYVTYKVGSGGFDTVQTVNAELQLKREEAERLALAARAEREKRIQLAQAERQRQLQAAQEEEQRKREKALRDLPLIKTVGQKICRTEEITTRKVIGTALGNPIYGTPFKQKATITAFTENSSGSKIQIRISGMQANGENLDRIDGDVVYQNGAVVWDEAANWGLCY